MQVKKPIETETTRLYDGMAWIIDVVAMYMTRVHHNIEEMHLKLLVMLHHE